MKAWRLLLWVESTTLKLATSNYLRLRNTGLYFLGTCWSGYGRRLQFPVLLLTLLQLQNYLVPCISVRIYIIPKLRNIYWRKFISDSISLCIEHLPKCYSVRDPVLSIHECRSIKEHLPHALPTETIFYLLRSTSLESILRDFAAESMLDTLEIIIKWLQVSVTDKPLRLKIWFLYRDLDPTDRLTCTIASRVNFVDAKAPLKQNSPPTFLDYEVWDLSVLSAIGCCNQCN